MRLPSILLSSTLLLIAGLSSVLADSSQHISSVSRHPSQTTEHSKSCTHTTTQHHNHHPHSTKAHTHTTLLTISSSRTSTPSTTTPTPTPSQSQSHTPRSAAKSPTELFHPANPLLGNFTLHSMSWGKHNGQALEAMTQYNSTTNTTLTSLGFELTGDGVAVKFTHDIGSGHVFVAGTEKVLGFDVSVFPPRVVVVDDSAEEEKGESSEAKETGSGEAGQEKSKSQEHVVVLIKCDLVPGNREGLKCCLDDGSLCATRVTDVSKDTGGGWLQMSSVDQGMSLRAVAAT